MRAMMPWRTISQSERTGAPACERVRAVLPAGDPMKRRSADDIGHAAGMDHALGDRVHAGGRPTRSASARIVAKSCAIDRGRIAQIVQGFSRFFSVSACAAQRMVGMRIGVVVIVVVMVAMMVMMVIMAMVMHRDHADGGGDRWSGGVGAFAAARVAVAADALDVMVMALLRRADLGLEAQHLRAIFADRAVHRGSPDEHLADALDEGVDHQRMVVEIGRLEEFDLGMSAAATASAAS